MAIAESVTVHPLDFRSRDPISCRSCSTSVCSSHAVAEAAAELHRFTRDISLLFSLGRAACRSSTSSSYACRAVLASDGLVLFARLPVAGSLAPSAVVAAPFMSGEVESSPPPSWDAPPSAVVVGMPPSLMGRGGCCSSPPPSWDTPPSAMVVGMPPSSMGRGGCCGCVSFFCGF